MRDLPICYLAPDGELRFKVRSMPGEPDNWNIVVRGKRTTRVLGAKAEQLEEFANCRDEISAFRRYTAKYGPMDLSSREDVPFLWATTLATWAGWRSQFQMTWDRIIGIEITNPFTGGLGKNFPELWKAQEPSLSCQAAGKFELTKTGLIYVADSQYAALVTKLLLIAGDGKLRKCRNPGCNMTPYFVAAHGKTQYCSELCGERGQRQAKLDYWHRTGRNRRALAVGSLPERGNRRDKA